MNSEVARIQQLIREARGGSSAALGELLEMHRPYLHVLARRRLLGPIQARLDASDLCQRTCLEVFENFDGFHGDTVESWLAWIREIHECTLKNALRDHYGTKKRTLSREEKLGDPARPSAEQFAAEQSTPSQRAMRSEDAVRLARALSQLPDDQAEAIRLRHLEGFSLAQIAAQFGRSETAVSQLIYRGMTRLREILNLAS